MVRIQRAINQIGLNDDEILVAERGKFTPHCLRDSYASLLAQSGEVGLYEIQHTTPTMTQKYANLIPSEVGRKAARVWER